MSRAQVLKMQTFKGQEDEAEVWILTCGADVTEDEARAWRESVDVETAGLLIDGIIMLSGLAKAGTTPNDSPGSEAPKMLRAVTSAR
jgi:hypothetical protein